MTHPDDPHPMLPPFGGENGWLYPAVAWALEWMTRFTVPRRFGLTAGATDTYIVGCTAAGFAAVAWLDAAGRSAAGHHAVVLFAFWRLFELLSITSFEFFVGSYRASHNPPLGRVVLLKMVNLTELIVLYGLLFYSLMTTGREWLGADAMLFNTDLPSASAALYFSAVTAATTGYGDYHPAHWTTRTLAVTEMMFFLSVAFNILGVLRSRAPLLPSDKSANDKADTEGTSPAA